MGREIKRVAMDFNWPIGSVWKGFINPHHYEKCWACDGSGYAPYARHLSAQWFGHVPFDPVAYGAVPITPDTPALIESVTNKVRWNDEQSRKNGERSYYTMGGRLSLDEAIRRECLRMYEHYKNQWCHHLIQADVDALIRADRLVDFTSKWTQEKGWQKKNPMPVVTAEQVNAWSLYGFGHDGINKWVCIKARCNREGKGHMCRECGGDGNYWLSEQVKAAYEAWEPEEPPAGDGYQLWETVSEGSPISPVFEAAEDLAEWLATSPDYIWRENDKGTTRETWLKFILGPGWACSLVMGPNGVQSGVEAAVAYQS